MDYLVELGEKCTDYDFSERIQYCILYFCVVVIKNEVFGIDDGKQLDRIQEILDDKLCKSSLYLSEQNVYNKEYTAIFKAMRSGKARSVNNIIKWYAFKKKRIAPILSKLRGK